MMTGTDATILAGAIASGLTLATQVLTILNTNFREARNRRWAEEDTAKKAEQSFRDKEELAKLTRHKLKETEQAIKLQFDELRLLSKEIKEAGEERLKQIVEHVNKKVDENSELSKAAFKEANNVNEKIASIGLQLKTEGPQQVIVANENPIKVTDEHNPSTKSILK